jgi:hypothetical protein
MTVVMRTLKFLVAEMPPDNETDHALDQIRSGLKTARVDIRRLRRALTVVAIQPLPTRLLRHIRRRRNAKYPQQFGVDVGEHD